MLLALIKKLLKRSFVIYRLPVGHPLHGQEMEDEINPLARVIKYFEYPWAEFHNSHPFVGLIETYHALVGNHYDLGRTGKGRKGALDYLLVFPLIGRILLGRLAFEPLLPASVRLCFLIVGLLLEIPRHALAIGIAIGLMPVVLLVHCYADRKLRRYKKPLDSLQCIKQVKVLGTTPEGEPSITTQEEHVNIIYNMYFPGQILPATVAYEGQNKVTGFEIARASDIAWKNNARFFLPLKNANREGIIALLAMNIGSILYNLKRTPSLFDEVQQWIKQPPTRPLQEAFLMGTRKLRPGEKNPSPIHGLVNAYSFDKHLIAMIFEMANLTEMGVALPAEDNPDLAPTAMAR